MFWSWRAINPIGHRQWVLISLPWADLPMLVGFLVFAVHVAVLPEPGALCMLGKHSTWSHITVLTRCMSLGGQSGSWATSGLFCSFSSQFLVFCWGSNPHMWSSGLNLTFKGNFVGSVFCILFYLWPYMDFSDSWYFLFWSSESCDHIHFDLMLHRKLSDKREKIDTTAMESSIPLGTIWFFWLEVDISKNIHYQCPQIMVILM